MSYVNAPICEVCWIGQNSEWDEVGRLLSVRFPVMARGDEAEQCGWCGCLTVVGIYVRAARTDLAYPPEES